MKGSNIYIQVLKYGADNLSKGITYNEAISYLGSDAPKGNFEVYFNNWFYDNFHSERISVLRKKQSEQIILTKDDLKEANGEQVFLTCNAYFKFCAYSSDNISKKAWISLVVASLSLMLSIACYMSILLRT